MRTKAFSVLRRCWYLLFLFLWKIKNVKIVIKSQDHFSYFLLKHARIKTEKYWIINVTIKTSSWLLIYCTIYFLSLDFTRILNIKYAEKRPLRFLSHTNKIVWDYIVWRDLNNQSVLDLLVKKNFLLKYLSFVMPAFAYVYRTLTPVQPLVINTKDTGVIIVIYSKVIANRWNVI